MSYQVLARKWRPRTFGEMVGQEHVLRALINALDNDRLHHAYLFTGTRGVGKTTIARILAKSLNCEKGVTSVPCGQCGACQEIDQGRFVDLIEVDAASRTKVEDTRELLENVQYRPSRGRYKVYLIDEVHMLSTHSFNALLKTLEEPPPHVKFLLATTDPQKLPVTILSRCLQFNLKRMPVPMIAKHLAHVLDEEKVRFEQPALADLARAADGSMRDALSLLDQAIAFGGGELSAADVRAMLGAIDRDHVYSLVDALAGEDGSALLEQVARLAELTPDFDAVLAELLTLLHRIALVQQVPGALDDSEGDEAQVRALADRLAPEDVQLFYQIGVMGRRDLPLAPDARVGLEMILLRMLAFQPSDVGSGSREAPPRAQSRAPVQGAAPVARSHTVASPGTQTPAPPRQEQARTGRSGPGVTEPAAAAAAPSVAGGDWASILGQLKLDGIARQLASNCVLRQRDGDKWELSLAPAHASFHTPKVEERLRKALSGFSGGAVTLKINIEDPRAETPAVRQARESEQRMQAAQRAIEEDENVRAIVDRFDARIVPDSIQPLE